MTEPSDATRSWLRTIIPGLWSALITGAAALGVPDWITTGLGGAGEAIVVPIVLALLYPLLRSLERHLPPTLRRLLLGSVVPPSYIRPPQAPARHVPPAAP